VRRTEICIHYKEQALNLSFNLKHKKNLQNISIQDFKHGNFKRYNFKFLKKKENIKTKLSQNLLKLSKSV
jgi:predicted DNA binding CopG/RHH family protein